MAEQMKPSGIDWIGDIPESWDVVRIKDIGTYRNGLTYAPEDIAEDDNGTLVLRSSNIQNGKISYDDNVYVKCSVSPELMVKKGDIIICSRNGSRELIGKNAIIENSGLPCSFGAFMMVYRCSCPRYMYYILNSEVFSYYLGTFLTSTINQLTGNNFGNMKIVFCKDRNEQKRIVDFLDKECAQIDSIAVDLEKQIELLQQYKKSLITEMTTPDDSCNWTKTKIKYIGEIRGRIGFRGYTVEDTVDPGTPGCAVVLGGTNIMKDGTTDYENLTFLSENKYFESPEIMLYGGEILITKVGAGTGENSVYDGRFERATTNPNVMILIPKKFVNSQYINYLLLSKPIKEDMKVESTKSGAQPAINQGYVNNVVIYIPTLERQDYIVEYLDTKCAEIDDTIRIKNEQLELIAQHKKSLIYEYVTGKKRVKEVQ